MTAIASESEIDNALVRQKDRLYKLLNDGRHAEVLDFLELSLELWCLCNYGYKIIEILYRCEHELFEQKVGLHHRSKERTRIEQQIYRIVELRAAAIETKEKQTSAVP
jgi:hypothetical protein